MATKKSIEEKIKAKAAAEAAAAAQETTVKEVTVTKEAPAEVEAAPVTLNLFQKIVEIRKLVLNFSKDKTSATGFKYKWVSGSQAIAKIREKMDELQVLLVPKMGETENDIFNYTTAKGKEVTDHIIKGDMTYLWINAENPAETLEVPWKLYGAQDDISKAYGTALTYSERYFILKFFQAPTDDLDPDSKVDPDKKEDTKSKGKYTPNKKSTKKLSEAQVNRLFAIGREHGVEKHIIKAGILRDYKKIAAEDLSRSEYDELCEKLKNVG